LENVRIYETELHPIVYGDWLKARDDKPTILIYGHYDVQPVDPIELWTDPPFEPVIRGGNIFARGAADDKGQVFIHMKSIQAHMKNNSSLPVNVKFLIEGEEEIGSVNLEKFIDSNKDLLKCDYVVVSDTSMFGEEIPSICYGLRGLAYMQVEVTGPNRDLHSGSFGGGVDNPINALAHIITKLKDDRGKILIDGFYDDVIDLSKRKGQSMQNCRLTRLSTKKVCKSMKCSAKRVTARWRGFLQGLRLIVTVSGVDFRVKVLKQFSLQSSCKISMRLVPNQHPEKIEKIFADYVKKIAPKTVRVEVKSLHGGMEL
jgi:acetylornithine deacetylase/succinyl-diaminopimelate desuccinylase-like protein